MTDEPEELTREELVEQIKETPNYFADLIIEMDQQIAWRNARICWLEAALLMIADPTPPEPGRPSYLDFELRSLAREALK